MSAETRSRKSNFKCVLEYLSDDSVIVNLPFIYVRDKTLRKGMPYMKIEGRHTDAVKLIDIWDSNEFVYLKVRDLKTGRCYTISWNLTYRGDYILWSLFDFETIMNQLISNKKQSS
jgi:hypothetical protein